MTGEHHTNISGHCALAQALDGISNTATSGSSASSLATPLMPAAQPHLNEGASSKIKTTLIKNHQANSLLQSVMKNCQQHGLEKEFLTIIMCTKRRSFVSSEADFFRKSPQHNAVYPPEQFAAHTPIRYWSSWMHDFKLYMILDILAASIIEYQRDSHTVIDYRMALQHAIAQLADHTVGLMERTWLESAPQGRLGICSERPEQQVIDILTSKK